MAPGPGKSSIGVRVRPNAHDFIRDLRGQLGTKTYTFWVDVRARTGKASADVHTWAKGPLQNIKVTVPVHANTGPASGDVAEWRRRQAQFKTVIPVRANMAEATRDVATWREIVSRDIHIKVRADTSTRGLEGVRKAASQDATVRVRADTTRVRRDIQESLQDDADSLFTVGINADTRKAKVEVREFFDEVRGEQLEMDLGIDTKPAETKIAEVKAKAKADNPKTQLDIDLKRAKLELLQLRIQEKARSIDIDVKVKKGALSTFQRSLKGFEKATGSFSLVRSLDVGPFNVGKPSGLIGTLTTITTLAAAVPTVVTALAALSNGLISVGAAAALVPGAIGAILGSLSTFTIATKGVSDAVGALAELWDEGASEQASAMRRQVQGQNNYRNALTDETRAQERVSQARRDALGDLRDLNNELRGSVLNEAQALLDLQKAKDRYAQGDFDNSTDRLQAQLDIRKAELNLDQTREKSIDTQFKANDAQAKGVEGSDKVRDALEAQTRASQQAAEALQQIASTQATGALGKFNDQLAQLSPNAQAFVMAMADQKGALVGFRDELQDTFFNGLAQKLTGTFNNLIPVIKPGMNAIAQGMNENMVAIFDTLESPDGKSIIERILGGTAETQKALSGFINPFIKGFGTLMAAGTEHLPQVVNLMTQLADRFATFVTSNPEGLDKFLDKGVDALGQIAEIGINVVKIINDFSDAFHNAFGEDLLQMLVRITGQFHDFLSGEKGQKKLNGYIQDARDLFAQWKPILEDLPEVFDAVQKGAREVLEIVLPVVREFAEFMKNHPGVVATFISAWLGVKVLVSPLLGIFNTIGGIIKLAGKIPKIVEALKKLGTFASGIPGQFNPGNQLTTPTGIPPVVVPPNTGLSNAAKFAGSIGPKILRAGAGPGASQDVIDLLTYLTDDEKAEFGDLEANQEDTPTPEAGKRLKELLDLADQRKGTQDGEKPWWERLVGDDAGWIKSLFGIGNYKGGAPNVGGFTPWPQQTGHPVMMHGKEYVQPADVTSYYGVDSMKAIHDKRIPPGLLKQFAGGSHGLYGGGRPPFPQDWVNVDPNAPTPLRASEDTSGSGSVLDAITTGLESGINQVGDIVNQTNAAVDGTSSPDPTGITHGATPGVLPGPMSGTTPDANTPGVSTPLDTGSAATLDIFGLKIPIGGERIGWPGGKPPIGLGGGDDGFDMRSMGFGPGPVGSTPGDWATFAGGIAGNFITSATSGLFSGLLDAVGLGGITQNISSASPLINHFLGGDKKAQGAGAGQTNSDVTDLLSTYDSMAGNPAYPGIPGLPNVIDPTTGSALTGGGGLQTNTLRGEKIIQKFFPWATDIGGVRPDALKWHPNGLALDVMTDPGHGNNDPSSPEGLARGNKLYAWLNAHKAELGIDYMMWQEKDHYNHIHVNFAPSGYPTGGGPVALPAVTPPAATGGNGGIDYTPPPGRPTAAEPGESVEHFGQRVAQSYLDANMTVPPGWQKYIPTGTANPLPKTSAWLPGAAPALSGGQAANAGKLPKPLADLFLGKYKGGMANKVMDRGGILGPGTTMVHNYTGKNELVTPMDSFYSGGPNLPMGYLKPNIPAPPPPPIPRGPDAEQIPLPAKPAVPSVSPSIAPPVAPLPAEGTPAGPPPQQQAGPGGAPISLGPRPVGGNGPEQDGMHLHPALQKGITSGFATAGNLAATAASIGAMGMGGGGGAGGGIGAMVSGLFQQGGKIATNIANVGASFLVGNITGGTTANAYGVTQHGSSPTGSSRVVDASSNQYGDIYTNNLDEYFAMKRREENVKAQSALGRWNT